LVVVPVKEALVVHPVTRAARGRARLLGVSLGLVPITLIVAGSAAAHHNVIDFRDTCSGHRADGHNHSDTIYGSRICSDTPDIFRGLFGDDRIFGYRGDDTLLKGSKGDDFVSGGAGSDRIEGSDGVDTLDGGAAADRIEGGPDGDVIFGGPGHDRIFGQSGSDEIHGNPGADDIDCGDGNDEAWGGGGHDTFVECETIHQ
jgi:Ca2+-binding RTX toxin-like protein